VALTSWRWQSWIPFTAVATVLLLCNVFPSPMGEHIRGKDQSQQQMAEAVGDLRRAVAPGSIIFTDEQSRFILTYYLCRSNRIQYGWPGPAFVEASCAGYRMISVRPAKWIFEADDFRQEIRGLRDTFQLTSAMSVWFFQAGWSVDDEPGLRALLPQYGCAPREFGRNIVECSISLADPLVAE